MDNVKAGILGKTGASTKKTVQGRKLGEAERQYLRERLLNISISVAATIFAAAIADKLWNLLDDPKVGSVLFATLLSICAFCFSFTMLEIVYHWRKYGARIGYMNKVTEYLKPVERTPLWKFAEEEIVGTIEKKSRIYSDLIGDGALIPLRNKMAIASALHDGNYVSEPPRDRYWATAIDDPVDMIRDTDFFRTQALLPCQSKRRLVVMAPELYKETLSDIGKIKKLKEFLAWHAQHGFDLRFLLTDVPRFQASAERTVWRGGSAPILTDFAVFDGRHVFGAVLTKRPESEDLQLVRLIVQGDLCDQYATFFEGAWDDHEALDLTTVHEDCAAGELRMENLDRIREQYGDMFKEKVRGRHFFDALCKIVADARERVVAVDIAALKDESDNIGAWMRKQYLDIVHATAMASRNGASCSRYYVIAGFLPALKIESLVSAVFEPQIDAGVKIFFLDAERLRNASHRPRDFIVIDGKVGFGLGRAEPFEPENLSLTNLITKEELPSLEKWATEWAAMGGQGSEPVSDAETCFEMLRTTLRRG